MFKLRLFIIVLIFNTNFSFCQSSLCILGTIHEPTKQVNINTIYGAIKNFKPDIILYEADTTYDILNNLNKIDLTEGRIVIEFHAIKKYVDYKPKTIILPFDWEEKQLFLVKNNFWEKIDSMNKIFNNYFNNHTDKYTKVVTEAYNDFSSLDNLIKTVSLRTQNEQYIRKLIELKSKWEYNKLIEMSNETEGLKTAASYLSLGLEYWNKRNQEMSTNVLKVIKKYPNKRILVLTGNNHKYFLYNLLEPKQIENRFILKEYWNSY